MRQELSCFPTGKSCNINALTIAVTESGRRKFGMMTGSNRTKEYVCVCVGGDISWQIKFECFEE